MKKTKNMIGVFVSILLFLFIFGVVIDQLEQWKNKKIFSQRVPSGIYDKFFKRPIDIVLSLIALVIFFSNYALDGNYDKNKFGISNIF